MYEQQEVEIPFEYVNAAATTLVSFYPSQGVFAGGHTMNVVIRNLPAGSDALNTLVHFGSTKAQVLQVKRVGQQFSFVRVQVPSSARARSLSVTVQKEGNAASRVQFDFEYITGCDYEGQRSGVAYCKDGCESSLSCNCLLYTSPSPRDKRQSRMPSSA